MVFNKPGTSVSGAEEEEEEERKWKAKPPFKMTFNRKEIYWKSLQPLEDWQKEKIEKSPQLARLDCFDSFSSASLVMGIW